MTQEKKELLLRDLCARLPYGVIIQVPELFYPQRKVNEKLVTINDLWHFNDDGTYIENVKPYLRLMSSMTDEELYELQEIVGKEVEIRDGFLYIVDSSRNSLSYLELLAVFDWLNAHHFDYRGLIDKGLAIEVTEENNPYK